MIGPDESKMLAWLRRDAVRDDGAVLSWVNPAHPGYPYPEVAGLWLTLLSREPGVTAAELERVATWVAAQTDEAGRVGRDGLRYSFDSAIVLVGLCQASRRGLGPSRELLARMGATLVADLEAAVVAFPTGEARWSTRLSAHLVKTRWAFAELDALFGSDATRRPWPAIDRALDRLLDEICLPDGRIRIRVDDDRSYVHASCYALEGMLAHRGRHRVRLEAGARWLASLQRRDGSLPNWVAAPAEPVDWPTDVVAQAVRIWAALDPDGFAEPIARACAQLRARQTPAGGLSYLPRGSAPADVNTCATLFALQAARWARGLDLSSVVA